MRTIELFSGTGSFSKVADKYGHDTLQIDKYIETDCDLILDLRYASAKSVNIFDWKSIDFMWASPPCTAFSVAAIGKNWDKDTKKPKHQRAEEGLAILENTIKIISELKPKYWCIENPRGMMRKVIDDIFAKYGINNYQRKTVAYCQYGDTRQKPTDLWFNFEWETKPMCKSGSSCHEAAPRGSRTGTQGLKGNKERSVIPPALFEEMLGQIEQNPKVKDEQNKCSEVRV